MFQGQFDIANKTLVQCYLLDEEMFVGEQRFVEDDIRKFMEYFCSQMEEIEETKIAEATKGITAKIKAGDKFMVEEEDPDFEANKDLVIKEVSSESESESESEEESEYSESDSDEEEEEEQEEEDEEEVDEEEEEEEDEVEKPTARFKQDQDLSSARLKQEDSSVEQSEEVSESQVKEEDEEEEEGDSDAEEEDEEDEEGEDEDEDEEEEDPKLNPANSNGGSLHSTEYNTKNLSLKTLLSNKPGGGAAFQGDAPSIFSKSKIQNSTIKIEDYDNDDTDGQYRL